MTERWPAALNLAEAAEYAGLSVPTFKQVCPLRPIAFTESSRGARYLRVRLDEWLAGLDPNKASSEVGRKFGEKLGGQGQAQRS
jgi:hypothetical protein